MKILISGYYGFGNVGDEAVLQAIIAGLRKRDHGIVIIVLSSDRSNWWHILNALWQTDLLISGGGTLLQNVTSQRSFFYYLALLALAKLFRKKAVVFAQGFGPLKGIICRACVRAVLNRVDLITLRDQDSVDQIKELGVNSSSIHLTADPTMTLQVPSADQAQRILSLEGVIKDNRPLLGIALRGFAQANQSGVLEKLAGGIDWLAEKHNFQPVFVLFQAPQDLEVTSQVVKYMKADSSVIFRACRPDEMLALISQFDLFIGMRLHSLIFAAMNCVPMLGLSYDPKVRAFIKSIGQPYIDLERLDLPNLKHKLEDIVHNNEKIKVELNMKKAELSRLARLNFELLNNLES